MDKDEVLKYVGKKVLIILKNGFKVTCIIPNFTGTSFKTVDKFNLSVSIECDSISLIYGQEEGV